MKKITHLGFSALLLCGLMSVAAQAQIQQHKQSRTPKTFGQIITERNQQSHVGHIRCMSTEYEQHLQSVFPKRLTDEQFENWLAPKIEEFKRMNAGKRGTTAVIRIPVVVHVIHNGDAYGTGENIRDEQVISQITVLNQDYRRMMGTPGYNTNPIGADVEVEFCLAQQNPSGGASTGIDRVNLGTASWGEAAVEGTLKPSTIWDPTRYLNMWTARFGGDLNGVLGYAQFPSNSGLAGFNANEGPGTTDGVIMAYNAFGSSAIYPAGTYAAPYDRGRTATHEVGHWLGLRHIWGDDACPSSGGNVATNEDFCADTPAAAAANFGCATGTNSCAAIAGNDMVENYMDYSDDTCMNIFTQDQKTRIITVLTNATRRSTLGASTACNPPVVYGFDASLDITNLNLPACQNTFAPSITMANIGTTTLTSAVISYNIDGGSPQTYNWNGSLATGASAVITLPTLTTGSGAHTFNTSITTVNGVADQNSVNDIKSVNFNVAIYSSTQVNFTLQRDRYGSETTWTLKNSANVTLYSGAATANANPAMPAVFNQTWLLATNECYTFKINDSVGDGICCGYGAGYYEIKTPTNELIASGGEFTTSESKSFKIAVLGTTDFNSVNSISLYPNPTNGILNINMGELGLPDNYTIINNLGQTVLAKEKISQSDLTVNTSALSNGVYFVKISKGGSSKTLRFIKN